MLNVQEAPRNAPREPAKAPSDEGRGAANRDLPEAKTPRPPPSPSPGSEARARPSPPSLNLRKDPLGDGERPGGWR